VLSFTVPNAATLSNAGKNPPLGNNVLTVFNQWPGMTRNLNATARAVIVLNKAPSAAEIAQIRDWAVSIHGAVSH
jgi:hypothetical protein